MITIVDHKHFVHQSFFSSQTMGSSIISHLPSFRLEDLHCPSNDMQYDGTVCNHVDSRACCNNHSQVVCKLATIVLTHEAHLLRRFLTGK